MEIYIGISIDNKNVTVNLLAERFLLHKNGMDAAKSSRIVDVIYNLKYLLTS